MQDQHGRDAVGMGHALKAHSAIRHQLSVVTKRLEFPTEMMRSNTGPIRQGGIGLACHLVMNDEAGEVGPGALATVTPLMIRVSPSSCPTVNVSPFAIVTRKKLLIQICLGIPDSNQPGYALILAVVLMAPGLGISGTIETLAAIAARE